MINFTVDGWRWSCLVRLMSCRHLLPDVLGHLLYSWHHWSVCCTPWHNSRLAGFLSLLIGAAQNLSFRCFIGLVCLTDYLSTHVFHQSLLPAWLYWCSWSLLTFAGYSDSMFHLVCWLVTLFHHHKYMELLNINLTFPGSRWWSSRSPTFNWLFLKAVYVSCMVALVL